MQEKIIQMKNKRVKSKEMMFNWERQRGQRHVNIDDPALESTDNMLDVQFEHIWILEDESLVIPISKIIL